MSLDNLKGIREYKDKVAEYLVSSAPAPVAIGMSPQTMLTLLETLLREIDRLCAGPIPGRASHMESVTEIVDLGQRRKMRVIQEPDGVRPGIATIGPDLVPLD